jgi:hypothetical protein
MSFVATTPIEAINITSSFYSPLPKTTYHASIGQTMLKAFILGLAISCLLLGIECLAVEQIKLDQSDSQIVIIPEIFGWLLIGIGSSTTLYTLIRRSSSPASNQSDLESSTTIETRDEPNAYHQWDTTDYNLTEHYHDDEDDDDEDEEYEGYDALDEDHDTDDEDYFETEGGDESETKFDLEKFNQQFDIDELLEE